MEPTTKERARSLAERIPTKWILTGLAALLLGASALFGGLDEAPADPIPVLEVGDTSEATRVALTVERVVVIDAFPEIFLEPDAGNRYLVVIGTAENNWSAPVLQPIQGAATVVSPQLEGLDATAPEEILVFSDATRAGDLQPGVPVQLAYLWQVPASLIADGDTVTLDLWEQTYEGDSFIGFGDRFSDPLVSATIEVPVDEAEVSDG